MVFTMKFPRLVLRCSAAAILLFALPGCERRTPEEAALKAENEKLKAKLAQPRGTPGGAKEAGSHPGKADLVLDINELWNQRFGDNDFRAKQRLSGKTIRVTGLFDGVSRETVSLYGSAKISLNVRLNAHLENTHASKLQDALASFEKGAAVTLQGKFAFDRMGLDDAIFVNKATGATLTPAEVLALANQGVGGPAPAEKPKE